MDTENGSVETNRVCVTETVLRIVQQLLTHHVEFDRISDVGSQRLLDFGQPDTKTNGFVCEAVQISASPCRYRCVEPCLQFLVGVVQPVVVARTKKCVPVCEPRVPIEVQVAPLLHFRDG